MNGPERPGALFPLDPGIQTVVVGHSTISYEIRGRAAKMFSLRTRAGKTGVGSARVAMELFLAEMDRHDIEVTLDASPLNARTKLWRLLNFYRSLGFDVTGRTINALGEPEMTRPSISSIERERLEIDDGVAESAYPSSSLGGIR